MTIDWTLPVETTEDPPRPVRVLATDGPNFNRPIAIWVADVQNPTSCTRDGRLQDWDDAEVFVRNVPPPKPVPVLREAWVVWDADGAVLFFTNETSARLNGGVYARAAVMSDGSPVPGEGHTNCWANYNLVLTERDHWKAKAEALQAEVDTLKKALFQMQEAAKSMVPVVDALGRELKMSNDIRSWRALSEVYYAYQSKQAPAIAAARAEGGE